MHAYYTRRKTRTPTPSWPIIVRYSFNQQIWWQFPHRFGHPQRRERDGRHSMIHNGNVEKFILNTPVRKLILNKASLQPLLSAAIPNRQLVQGRESEILKSNFSSVNIAKCEKSELSIIVLSVGRNTWICTFKYAQVCLVFIVTDYICMLAVSLGFVFICFPIFDRHEPNKLS